MGRTAFGAVGFFSTFLLAVLTPSLAGAQSLADAQERVRKSLVYLEAKAETTNGVPIQASGTGFIIEGGGRLLTTYHIIAILQAQATALHQGDISPNSLKLIAHVGAKGATPMDAEVVTHNQDRDMLVLKLPSSPAGAYPSICIDRNFQASRLKQELATAGFPEVLPYLTGVGRLTSSDGPNGTLVTDMIFNEGQSGSPVFTVDGAIVGIAKGQMADSTHKVVPGLYVFIPIADALSIAPMLQPCSGQQASPPSNASSSRDICIRDGLAQFIRREDWSVTGGARAPGPGINVQVMREQSDVCFQAPPGATLAGQVIIRDLGNNGGRGSLSAVNYQPQTTNATRACVTAIAWSEPGPFTAGGWQNVELKGKIQFSPTDTERQAVIAGCPPP